ncbi:MAG: aminotransferase class I/II-fold pyridoxal phosphate-dependent enzyme, partial [Polyangiaceae bacterium]
PWNIPAITLAAASAALDDAAEFDARISELRLAREELTGRLRLIDGLEPVPSEGNFVLIDVSATGQSAERIVESMLKDGVLIRSLSVHHAKRSYVRVTVGTREQNLRCIAAFERVLGGRHSRPVREAPRPYLTVAGASDAE